MPMTAYESMITSVPLSTDGRALAARHERACPYCHEPLAMRVDADTHIVGCSDRWRRDHHIAPSPAPAPIPTVDGWRPEPASPAIEAPSDATRRVIEAHGWQPERFRSFGPYEPAP